MLTRAQTKQGGTNRMPARPRAAHLPAAAVVAALLIGAAGCAFDPGAAETAAQLDELRGGNARKDRTPPSLAITTPTSGATVAGTITVAGAAGDDVGLSRVELAVDAGAWLPAAGTSSWSRAVDTRSLADGTHTLTARATDTGGNQASASVSITVTNAPPPDPAPAPPLVSITAPAAGAAVAGPITVAGSAADPTGLARVEVRVDAGAWTVAAGLGSWSYGVDTRSLANGSHLVTARATNTSGLQSTATLALTVSNPVAGGLAVAITAPGPGATVTGLVTVSGTATGASHLRGRVDAYAFLEIPLRSSWSYTFDSAVLANGAHSLTVRAEDAAGNAVTAPLAFTASNANTPPTLAVTSPAAGATVSGLVELTGFAHDKNGVGQVEVAVDGGAFQRAQGFGRWSLELDTAGLANGAHVLWARVMDDLGALTTRSTPFTVANAEVVRPTITIGAPKAGVTVSGLVTVTGSASDNAGVAKVEVKESSSAYRPAAGTGSWSYQLDTRGLANGSHTILARAVDTSGHVASAAVAVTVANGYAKEIWVTPEGARIEIDSAAGWSAAAIYRMLQENALDLAVVGPTLTIRIDDLPGASAQTSCSATSCTAMVHLGSGAGASFAVRPEQTLAHEYGHVWTLRHLRLTQSGAWSAYLGFRGLDVDPRLDSSYPTWDRAEIIADDYKEIFGSAAARGYSRRAVAHPAGVPGLEQFLLDVWAGRP